MQYFNAEGTTDFQYLEQSLHNSNKINTVTMYVVM